MQHKQYEIVPTKSPKKVAVVGSGIGGVECTQTLKKRGHTPLLFEKSDKLGWSYIIAAAMSFKDTDHR